MGRVLMFNLQAWEGIFTKKQYIEISNMSKDATKNGVFLHDVIEVELLRISASSKQSPDKAGFIKKPVGKCPNCANTLKVFSLSKAEMAAHPGMMSKWECCKTCSSKSKPCGYVKYNKETVEQIIAEGKNGTSK